MEEEQESTAMRRRENLGGGIKQKTKNRRERKYICEERQRVEEES